MILSQLIIKWLEWVIEIGLWLSLIGAFIAGWSVGNGFFGSLISAILATVATGVFCALVFGAFILLMNISESLKRIDAKTGEEGR